MSEPVCQVLGSGSEEISSKMSVAELQSYEHNGMVSGQKCDLVIGQREGSSKKYVQNVTNLAKSRQIRCISADTKGGPSSIRGGGHALKVIQEFEESLLGKTDKQIISKSTGDTEKKSVVSPSLSSEKTRTLARKFGKIQRGNNISILVNITPTKRKLIIDQYIHTLISNFENTAANHHCGGGGEKVRPSEGCIPM